MKKVFFLALVLVCLFLVIAAADYRSIPDLLDTSSDEPGCVGYTIIAFDKGVDCHGDTVALSRRNGFAEKVSGKR
jgi:hypothetical protein